MMISRSGDILEISTSMYLYIFLLKYARSASYQHNTTYTKMTTHEIVRDLASFKMYKKECTLHAPLRSTSTCSDRYTQEVVQIEFSLFLKGWHPLLKHHRHEFGGATFFLNIYIF